MSALDVPVTAGMLTGALGLGGVGVALSGRRELLVAAAFLTVLPRVVAAWA